MKTLYRRAAREGFFFYLLRAYDPQRQLLTAYLAQKEARTEVLQEIMDIDLLLNNKENNPRYAQALLYWSYRLTRNSTKDGKLPSALTTDDGVHSYLEYLFQAVNPRREELERAMARYSSH